MAAFNTLELNRRIVETVVGMMQSFQLAPIHSNLNLMSPEFLTIVNFGCQSVVYRRDQLQRPSTPPDFPRKNWDTVLGWWVNPLTTMSMSPATNAVRAGTPDSKIRYVVALVSPDTELEAMVVSGVRALGVATYLGDQLVPTVFWTMIYHFIQMLSEHGADGLEWVEKTLYAAVEGTNTFGSTEELRHAMLYGAARLATSLEDDKPGCLVSMSRLWTLRHLATLASEPIASSYLQAVRTREATYGLVLSNCDLLVSNLRTPNALINLIVAGLIAGRLVITYYTGALVPAPGGAVVYDPSPPDYAAHYISTHGVFVHALEELCAVGVNGFDAVTGGINGDYKIILLVGNQAQFVLELFWSTALDFTTTRRAVFSRSMGGKDPVVVDLVSGLGGVRCDRSSFAKLRADSVIQDLVRIDPSHRYTPRHTQQSRRISGPPQVLTVSVIGGATPIFDSLRPYGQSASVGYQ